MQSACVVLYCCLRPVRLYHISPHLTNGKIFEKKTVIEHKMSYSLQILFETFLILRRIQLDTDINGTALLVGRSRDRFPVVSLGIFSVATDGTMCPGVDSASKHEYQGFLLG